MGDSLDPSLDAAFLGRFAAVLLKRDFEIIRDQANASLNVLPARVERVVPIKEVRSSSKLRLGDERLLTWMTRRSGEALVLAPEREVFASDRSRQSFPRSGETAGLDDDNEIFRNLSCTVPELGQQVWTKDLAV